MDENSFEGSSILEKLAELGLLDKFYEAVDSDDFSEAISLLRESGFNEETIESTIQMMQD